HEPHRVFPSGGLCRGHDARVGHRCPHEGDLQHSRPAHVTDELPAAEEKAPVFLAPERGPDALVARTHFKGEKSATEITEHTEVKLQHEDTKTRRHEDTKTRRHEDTKTRRHEGRRHGVEYIPEISLRDFVSSC